VEPAISLVMGDAAAPVLNAVAVPQTADHLPETLFGVRACGFLAILVCWIRRWMRVRAVVRAASLVVIDVGIPVVSSAVLWEPGVFGVCRPALLLPEGIKASVEVLVIEQMEKPSGN
jgi:hypothetical protein